MQNIPPLTLNHLEYTSIHPCQLTKNVHPAPPNQNISPHTPAYHKTSPSKITFTNPHLTHNIKFPIIIYGRVVFKFKSQYLDFYSFYSIFKEKIISFREKLCIEAQQQTKRKFQNKLYKDVGR